MFGSHLSIAGGMTNALDEATALGLDCVQVFTKNQRQWKAPPLKDDARNAWLKQLRDMKWDFSEKRKNPKPARTVSHNSYLINLASPDSAAWKKSIGLMRVELERCEELHIPFCVSHPGAHLGESRKAGVPHELGVQSSKDEQAGLERIAKALDQLHDDLPGYRTITCLETTVGSGSNLGYDFQHLAFIRDTVKEPERVGFCFDTCHVTAAGYDMTTDTKAKNVLRQFDKTCGIKHLHVMHLNDSIGDVGSRKDRHAHIGDGTCGLSCFRAIVNHRTLKNVPKILETPKGEADDGRPWDTVNLERLRKLIIRRKKSPAKKRAAGRSRKTAGT